MPKRSLKINQQDNVATALEEIDPGEPVEITGVNPEPMILTSKDRIPFGHKMSIEQIDLNSTVIKYGASIGTTTRSISIGEHVHVHNLMSSRAKGAEVD